MQIIMGGSGSTGSSLLKNILNRHHEIFSGGETAFFAKKSIYENWKTARYKVLKRKYSGLRNHGWHIYNGTDLLQKEYLWGRSELETLLQKSNSLLEFTSSFYERPLELNDANLWLEKTPANSACFTFFLNSFQNGKAIHVVRNPFDTIASLMNRGYNLYYATGIYLLNTACGVAASKSKRVHTVKYEDLTTKPDETVRKLCSFLDIDFSYEMLQPQGEVLSLSKLDGWQYDETKAIAKGSVGRFNKLSDNVQHSIMEAVNLIQINGQGKAYYNTGAVNIKDLCEELGYVFYDLGKTTTSQSLKKMLVKDRFTRLRRGYPTGIYYPLEIRK